MKIASIVGTRPQFIKLSQVSKQVRRIADEVIIHTGQHYDNELNQLLFDELGIPDPDHSLDIGSGSHGWQTGEMLREIEKTLILEHPDLTLVYGDCNTTLAGALAATKLGIPVGHVEAGYRIYQRTPEEINRRCIDHISDLLFAISEGTEETLRSEKVFGRVFNVGSTVVDACLHFSKVMENTMGLEDTYFVLTLHRPHNVDLEQNAHRILDAVYKIPEQIVFPIHPRTRKSLTEFNLLEELEQKENIILVPPMGYLDFLALLKGTHMIISDSGSIQQEAMALRKKSVRLLPHSPTLEMIAYPGGVRATASNLIESISYLNGVDEDTLTSWDNPFGDGNASKRIAEIIENEA